jgi:hypothetical protein
MIDIPALCGRRTLFFPQNRKRRAWKAFLSWMSSKDNISAIADKLSSLVVPSFHKKAKVISQIQSSTSAELRPDTCAK